MLDTSVRNRGTNIKKVNIEDLVQYEVLFRNLQFIKVFLLQTVGFGIGNLKMIKISLMLFVSMEIIQKRP